MKRDPSRPKAAHIQAQEFLLACERFSDARGPHPYDQLCAFPRKVVKAKLVKLNARGLVDQEGRITHAGRAKLTEMLEAAS